MSIDTLLEAAKFVEWSSKQHDARGINEPDVQNSLQAAVIPATTIAVTVETSSATVSTSPLPSPGSQNSSSPGTSAGHRHTSHHPSTSNTDTYDEGDDKRSGTREVHNKLEKNRRAHLKECFDNLCEQVPSMDDRKIKPSNLSILQGALRYLQALKRKERELDYEKEHLARQKIQSQEKLAKLRAACPWKVEHVEHRKSKHRPPAARKETSDSDSDGDNEEADDRNSVSTSTSTASEAEEEERKSRAQSPEIRSNQVIQPVIKPESLMPSPLVRVEPTSDNVIKVTQSIKEQSGPFVISRQIVSHIPIATTAGHQAASRQSPVVARQQKQRKVLTSPQTSTVLPQQTQQVYFGAKQQAPAAPRDLASTCNQSGTTGLPEGARPVVAKPSTVQVKVQEVSGQKIVSAKKLAQSTSRSSQKHPHGPGHSKSKTKSPSAHRSISHSATATPRSISHSSAMTAVQEHLKNKAQNRQIQLSQQKQPIQSVTTPTPIGPATSTGCKPPTVAATTAVTTNVNQVGVARQTVSQLLGKTALVVRQPVRRPESKYIVQRLPRQRFIPPTRDGDVKPRLNSSNAAAAAQEALSSTAGGAVHTISTQAAVSVQQVAPTSGLDVKSFISPSLMLPQYLSTPGLTSTMIRPAGMTNPNVLTAANAALLGQAMMANARTATTQLTFSGGQDGSHVKLQSSPVLAGAIPTFLSPAIAHDSKASGKQPVVNHGPSYLTPGLTLQPALTQVLFTQPPVAAYTVADSPTARTMVNAVLPKMHHTAVAGGRQMVPPSARLVPSGGSVSQTVGSSIALPPVVTIGAVALNPLFTTNRLVTAPTYSTLSFGQFQQHYRFPLHSQMPILSPVTLTGNANSVMEPVSAVIGQTNGMAAASTASNGVVVHAISDPSMVRNGVPVKEIAPLILTSKPMAVSAGGVVATTESLASQPDVCASEEGSVGMNH